MADKLMFDFVEKEGKFFTPIVQEVPNYVVDNGAVVQQGDKIVSGVKGVRARVRMMWTPTTNEQVELFALNTEFFQSSN